MLSHRITHALSLWIALVASTAIACRYSVRDTGFVEIGAEPYRLLLGGGDTDNLAPIYRQSAAATFLDANIEFAVADSEPRSEPSLTLSSREGRRLLLRQGREVPTDRAAITTFLEWVALSPFRTRLHEESLEAFAVVALVEGTDARQNSRARAAIDAAIAEVTQLLPTMPKPVTVPPRVLTLPASDIANEQVFVWGLGLDPAPTVEPRVAVLFGRGRRIGDALEGPLITQTTLQERLVMIGQDCECELDRSWLKGPLLPARWDQGRQSTAASVLGFDPENPMVRTEISRIVLRGPTDGTRRKLAGSTSALGYDEMPVEATTGDIEPENTIPLVPLVASATPPAANSLPPATVDRTERLLWASIVGGVLAATVVAAQRWRRARREQG